MAENITALLSFAREKGIEVVHIQAEYCKLSKWRPLNDSLKPHLGLCCCTRPSKLTARVSQAEL